MPACAEGGHHIPHVGYRIPHAHRARRACKQIIKNSRVPIICIANDGYNQKIKSLKNYCLELKFSKPMHTMVVKRLKMIAEVFNFMYLISESLCRACPPARFIALETRKF